jgi:hypothetical protein
MAIGQRQREKLAARLQVTSTHEFRDVRTGEVRTLRPSGLELGVAQTGKPMLTIGGREAPRINNKLGIGGGTGTTVLVVGGVVLLLLVVAAASGPPDIFPDDD